MSTLTKKLALALLTATALSGAAQAETVTLTLLGVGDVYNFDEAGGRGGFARLNAVAKAEKAANPNTLYRLRRRPAVALAALGLRPWPEHDRPRPIWCPSTSPCPAIMNSTSDRRTSSRSSRPPNIPWAALNITNADGSAIDGLGGTLMKEVAGVKVALVPVAQDTSPEVSSTGDLKFTSTVDAAIAGAKAAREAGADLVVVVVQGNHAYDREIMRQPCRRHHHVGRRSRLHDRLRWHHRLCRDLRSTPATSPRSTSLATIGEKDGKRTFSWSPNFRYIDTADVTPDPDTQAKVDAFKAQLDESLNVEIGMTEGPLDSRAATSCAARNRRWAT